MSGCFTKEGQVAATGGKGRIVSLWDADGGEQVMKMPPHLAAISALNVIITFFFMCYKLNV